MSIRQRGGLFGVDRTVRVHRQRISVVEAGREGEVHLTAAKAKELRDLARRVVAAKPISRTRRAGEPDAMRTDVEIANGSKRLVSVSADDSSPDAVWELVGALSDVADGTDLASES